MDRAGEGRLQAVKVRNHHERRFLPPARATLSTLLDQLATPGDRLWPHEVWPPMRLDPALVPGARGGHGPIRYAVCRHEPGTLVEFRFLAPQGFNGRHRFEIIESESDVQLHHVLEMRLEGLAVLTWPLVFRPLHDALVEDALAKAQQATGDSPALVPWGTWVRLLRRLLGRKTPRPQRHLLATRNQHR